MSKFNKTTPGRGPVSPLVSVASPTLKTYNGMTAARPDDKTQLFKMGVNLLAGNENTFYENGKMRDDRFTSLVEKLAVADPTWTAGFLKWLRTDAYIRTASLIGAAHFVHARLKSAAAVKEDAILAEAFSMTGLNRYVVDQVMQRADEPGEFYSYWHSKFGKLPKPAKRGLGDAANRLFNEYSAMKYGTDSHAVGFADILNLTHAKPVYVPWRDTSDFENEAGFIAHQTVLKTALFKYIVDKRYGNEVDTSNLPMIAANIQLRSDAVTNPKVLLDAKRVKDAGMTWEDVLSLAGSKVAKDLLWEAIIPSMGIMALIRNLRNFEEAGICKDARNYVIAKLTDPDVIAKSMQFPYRFLSAYNNTSSLAYKAALEEAVSLSVQNIPELDGGTLVLVDVSGSMTNKMSSKSTMNMKEVGSLFGAALALKNPGRVTLGVFADTSKVVDYKKGESLLPLAARMRNISVGGGTNTTGAVQALYNKSVHKRVIIITDEQANYSGAYNRWSYYYSNSSVKLSELCTPNTWMYSFNLAGYEASQMETGKDRRYQLGGLTDATFKMIPLMEAGDSGAWPWMGK